MKSIATLMVYVILSFITLIFLFPIIWTFLSSIKTDVEQYSIPPVLFPSYPTLDNYVSVFTAHHKEMLNSVVVGLTSTLIAIILGTMAAYGFARYRFPLNNILLIFILVTRMIPHASIIIPVFILMRSLGIIDTLAAVIMAHLGLQLPFCTWLIRSFLLDFPRDLEDAARIDGCSNIGIIFRVVIPSCAPGFAVATIMALLTSWNDLLFVLILTRTEVAKTMTVAIAEHVTAFAIHWGPMTAASVIYVIPVIIFTIVLQKYLIRGLTLGAIKA